MRSPSKHDWASPSRSGSSPRSSGGTTSPSTSELVGAAPAFGTRAVSAPELVGCLGDRSAHDERHEGGTGGDHSDSTRRPRCRGEPGIAIGRSLSAHVAGIPLGRSAAHRATAAILGDPARRQQAVRSCRDRRQHDGGGAATTQRVGRRVERRSGRDDVVDDEHPPARRSRVDSEAWSRTDVVAESDPSEQWPNRPVRAAVGRAGRGARQRPGRSTRPDRIRVAGDATRSSAPT